MNYFEIDALLWSIPRCSPGGLYAAYPDARFMLVRIVPSPLFSVTPSLNDTATPSMWEQGMRATILREAEIPSLKTVKSEFEDPRNS